MRVTLTDKDFEGALSKSQLANVVGPDAHLGPETANAMEEMLPRVLVAKFKAMLPAEFVIQSIELKVEVGGRVFGCGLTGEATVTFGPGESRK